MVLTLTQLQNTFGGRESFLLFFRGHGCVLSKEKIGTCKEASVMKAAWLLFPNPLSWDLSLAAP